MQTKSILALTSLLLSSVISAPPSKPQVGRGVHRRCFDGVGFDGFGFGGPGFGGPGFGGCGFGGCGFGCFPVLVANSDFVNSDQFCVNDFNRNTQAAVFCDNICDHQAECCNFNNAFNNVAVI